MIEDKAVLNAYWLWKDNLINNDIFFEALFKIKSNKTTTNTPEITQGQVNYIQRLIREGKIPPTQSLNITKTEAQILIHNAINTPIRKDEKHNDTTIPEDLMKETEDY